uniref:Uncharacterized protein n=1 Tax=Pipistrellus kuhlii TaxID=59472 RepID=A0A7J7TPT6_PIPKU|nr:hypothetical protein mPipKuh1_009297 [Pipistrellus kuhlii]
MTISMLIMICCLNTSFRWEPTLGASLILGLFRGEPSLTLAMLWVWQTSGWQTVALEPHAALWPLECGLVLEPLLQNDWPRPKTDFCAWAMKFQSHCMCAPTRGILWKSHTQGAKEPHVAPEPQFVDHWIRTL